MVWLEIKMARSKILTYTYVDNSNIYIEGQRLAAVKKGMAIRLQDAFDRKIFDFTWNVDYGKLHAFLCGEKSEIGSRNFGALSRQVTRSGELLNPKAGRFKPTKRAFAKNEKSTQLSHITWVRIPRNWTSPRVRLCWSRATRIMSQQSRIWSTKVLLFAWHSGITLQKN